MKIKATPSFSSSPEFAIPSRLVSRFWGLGVAALLLSGIAMADSSTNRDLRRYGFAGSYSGVMRCNEFFRTNAAVSFTVSPVSRLATEALPQKESQKVKSPFGEGTDYLLHVRTVVSRRQVVVRGLYYGESYNPALGVTTTRSGSKVITLEKRGGRGLSPMQVTDNMTETNAAGAILAKWRLKAILER